jgi:hypothetical protein
MMSEADQAAIASASAILQMASLQVSVPDFKPADTSVNSISGKLPDFLTKEPKLLFTQAKFNFRSAKITCRLTKYDYMLQQLLMDVLVSVKELARRVRTGEVADPYEQPEAQFLCCLPADIRE